MGGLKCLLRPMRNLTLIIPLQPRLDRSVLLIEVGHIRHQVLHHIHVGEGVDLGRLVVGLDLGQTGQSIDTTNINCTRTTYSLPAGSPECEGWIHLIFYFNESV